MPPGLGRIPQPALGRIVIPDPSDAKFPLRAALPKALQANPQAIPRSRSWGVNWVGDQGDSSQCVGFSWHGFLRAQPLRRGARDIPPPLDIYTGAQKNDEWPGESPSYEGSSIRGGAKFVLEQLGTLAEYRWASTVEEMVAWLSSKGPIVFGTNWYQDMFTPRGPLAMVSATGPQEGGHAYLCYGYEYNGEVLKFVNSWGRKWGENRGRFRMLKYTVKKLLDENGEACVAIKKALVS